MSSQINPSKKQLDTIGHCRKLFLQADEFGSNERLKSVFILTPLHPYIYDLPEANTIADRVDFCLSYLLNQRLPNGRPILPIFIASLQSHYDERDLFHKELGQLIEIVETELADNSIAFFDNFLLGNVLDGLLTDTIPPQDLSSLPRGSRMPLKPNPHFVGREEDLLALAKSLMAGSITAISPIAAATGLGGVGKTQLAVSFAYSFGRYFSGGVFWLNMENSDTILSEIAACGGPEGMNLHSSYDELPLEKQIALVRREWKKPIPRLLLYDNCEDPNLVAKWLPEGGCRILITSRKSQWPKSMGVQTLGLGMLSRAESIALLKSHCPLAPEKDLENIAQELGDLPLALHLAGSFMETYETFEFGAPKALLKELKNPNILKSPALTGDGAIFSPTFHDISVYKTFAVSFKRLDKDNLIDHLAISLLSHAACFAAGEPIPQSLLLETLREDMEGQDLILAKGLNRLLGTGLLKQEGLNLYLHRLVSFFVFEELSAYIHTSRTRIEKTLHNRANELNEQGDRKTLSNWQIHLRHVCDNALANGSDFSANLCDDFGYFSITVSSYQDAILYLKQALELKKSILDLNDSSLVATLNNLGFALKKNGQLREALPYLEQALQIDEKVYGANHPEVALSLNELGDLSLERGDFNQARSLFKRALDINVMVFGKDSSDTAVSLNNMGLVSQKLGKYQEAQSFFEQALSTTQNLLGDEHPYVATCLNNLGFIFYESGDNEAALENFNRSLSINEKVFGKKSPGVALNLMNIGLINIRQGNLTGAKKYLDQALNINKSVLGEDHPDTGLLLYHLGILYRKMNKNDIAKTYLYSALSIFELKLGSEHPNTVEANKQLKFLDLSVDFHFEREEL